MLDLYQKLDKIDRDILVELSKNARASYADIGRTVNLSRAAVRDRIQSLVQQGVIERFGIVVNPKSLDLNLSVHFDIEVEPHVIREVADKLKLESNVLSIYQMTGPAKLHVHAVLRDSEHLEQFLHNNLYSLNGILRIETNILITRFKSKSDIKV